MSRVEERIRVEPDGTITALSGKMEYGQGLRAAYPRIVAEELGLSPSRVHVVLGDTDVAPWDMGTFGSMSVEMDGLELRRAAAFARAALLARASELLQVPATELTIDDGGVRRKTDGRVVVFAELVGGAPITGEIPEDQPLASPAQTCPDAPLGADAVDFVTGRVQFVGDVRLPGMLRGCVAHPSTHGATLHAVAREQALAMPGVVAVVVEGNFAGVVAERQAQALAALRVLDPQWDSPPAPVAGSEDVTLRQDPGVDAALARASRRVARRYFTPHIANAPLGPSAGVADVRSDEAFVYATTQTPFGLRDAVAGIAGLPPERVHFRPRAMSGGYGRHGASDAAIEAARLSKAVGRPVMVQWSRADELHGAPNRPEMDASLEAALDGSGQIVAWRFDAQTNPYSYSGPPRAGSAQRRPAVVRPGWDPAQMSAMMAGRNALPPYDVGLAEVRLHIRPGRVRTGALRSLGASPNVFAIESFVDEIACAAGVDPIDFRLRHASDPRLRRALQVVRERSGWTRAERADGRGLGVACVVYRATVVAQVVEVSVAPDGQVRLDRVWCAVDAGHIVHPDGARNQVEGAVQMAASWALIEELPHREGEVLAATWDDYPIATFLDAPRAIDVAFVGDDATPSSGLGEPPAVPVAPAIANAVFAACGARVRRLPVRREAVVDALRSSSAS